MAVAAARKHWFPYFFTSVGRVGIKPTGATAASASSDSDSTSDAPINAIILSALLSTLYILFGNFRALLTFNGLGEYTFFFLVVLGAIVLRFREPDLQRPYKPFILIPVVFAIVSGFVVIRGAVFAPVQAAILLLLWALGLVVYVTRSFWIGELEA